MNDDEQYVIQLPSVASSHSETNPPGTMAVTEVQADGTVVESVWIMPEDLVARLAEAREEWKRLEEAGTPYWCVHDDASVTDDTAYWWDDHPGDPIYFKHGVRCSECGGYIQVG